MRVLEDLKIGNTKKYMVDNLNSLPDRAKEIMFSAMDRMAHDDNEAFSMYWQVGINSYIECESPIEKILYVAMDIVYILRDHEFGNFSMCIDPQMVIEDKSKTYRVDFGITIYDIEDNGITFVVECDGHDFHQKTKQQVKRDNEREMRLKLLGYDVLRFSGTQIYENPMKCANDVIDYALTKIKSR